jgi:Cu2+-containing amine oxidase
MVGTQHALAGHPLDPLTAAEVARAASVVRADNAFAGQSGRCRFITIALQEPPKSPAARFRHARPRS